MERGPGEKRAHRRPQLNYCYELSTLNKVAYSNLSNQDSKKCEN